MAHAVPKPWRACAPAPAVAAPGAQTGAADSAMARLLIHAPPAGSDEGATLGLALRRLRLWTLAAAHRQPPALHALRIADLDGRSYFSAEELPAVIDLALPAGIYHLSVSHGAQQRRYTVALGPGVAFHLHLRGD